MNGTSRLMVIILALPLVIAACSDNVVGPENEPEVVNVTGSFEWQVSDLEGVSQTFTYEWRSTGTTATVDQSPKAGTNGTARLTIRGADGALLYSRSLTEDGTFETGSGDPGDWTIEVVLSDVTGTLNFRVENP